MNGNDLERCLYVLLKELVGIRAGVDIRSCVIIRHWNQIQSVKRH